jgi:hypothetical protein
MVGVGMEKVPKLDRCEGMPELFAEFRYSTLFGRIPSGVSQTHNHQEIAQSETKSL